MAALRIFARSAISPILHASCAGETVNRTSPIAYQVQQRWASSPVSKDLNDPGTYIDFDRSKDPNEWKYVERLLSLKTVPEPPTENRSYPSGWKPATASPKDNPYYIQRTKNHMQPLYLLRKCRGMQRITVLRKIQGDIWSLEKELQAYLKKETSSDVATKINEFAGILHFKGDYVSALKRWIDNKGF